MRARYTAYAVGAIDFLFDSLHPDASDKADRKSAERWSKDATWRGLDIVETLQGQRDDEEGVVEFVARYSIDGQSRRHHERATFRKHEGEWRYLDGEQVTAAPVRMGQRVGRNSPCPCGSGKKYKKCCGKPH